MRYQISLLITACLLLNVASSPLGQSEEYPFYWGVDLSYVNEMDDCGAIYRVNGDVQDAFAIFAGHGATLVRARLWHDATWTAYSDLADVGRTFQRAKQAGMATMLDFHYSDNWADPGRQEIPLAWQPFAEDVDALSDALYQYTYDVLMTLHADDLTPDFIQVGNETNSGMLQIAGADLNWARQARLFNAGIQAVRDFSDVTNTSPQIILHIAQPENTGWWFGEAESAGITDFDVIGISYYPQWSTFSIADMGAHVGYLRQRFGKDVMVVETAYAWTREAVAESADNILNRGLRGYAFSPEGQLNFMTDLTQSLISNGALGIVYWEPAWVSTGCSTRWGQGSHWENATFFDFQNDNEVLMGINHLNHAYWHPDVLVDGHIDEQYDHPLIVDSVGDVLDGTSAFDLSALYVHQDANMIQLALEVAGNIFSERGSYLIYMDTTEDERGADVDPMRRPITVASPYQPEYRLDISVKDERGTVSGTYVLHAWTGDSWTQITFTGGIIIQSGTTSVIEVQMPRALLGNPDILNIAVISTNQGRVSTAGDILGTDITPSDWSEALILETFFNIAERPPQ